MATQLTGDYVIRLAEVRVELSAEDARFGVTLTNSGDRIWRYNISAVTGEEKSQRAASGRVIAEDCLSAARRVAVVAGDGYEPGTVERGLLDAMAAGGISGWQDKETDT